MRARVQFCVVVCRQAGAFITHVCVLVCALDPLPVPSAAKPGQARWTARGIIYGLVNGVLVLNCSILIADAPPSWVRVREQQGQYYYVSVECIDYKSILRTRHRAPSPQHRFSLLWNGEIWNNRELQGGCRRAGCKQKKKKCSFVSNASPRWVISGVCVKEIWKCLLCFFTLTASEWLQKKNFCCQVDPASGEGVGLNPVQKLPSACIPESIFYASACQRVHRVFVLQTENKNSCKCQRSACLCDIWFFGLS